MAVDPGQVTEQQDVGAAPEGASDSPTKSGGFSLGRSIRGWLGVGGDPEPSEAVEESTESAQPATPAPAQSETRPYTQAEIDKLVQSRSDQLLTRQQREWAKSRADEGDLAPIRQLAEKRDAWALQQLKANGDIWALGEIAAKELEAQERAQNDPIPHVATMYDQTILHPILAALPEEEERRIVGEGIVGFDGRQRAVAEALKVIVDRARAEGAKDAEQKLRRNPAVLKQVVLGDRAEREEPDLIPAVGGGRTASPDDAIRAAVLGR